MIRLKNIAKSYSTANSSISALSDINSHIHSGEIFGIIGESGAGKSTLLRTLNLLERPTSGQVLIADKDLNQLTAQQLRDQRKKMGMIFQHFNLLNLSTVQDNILLPLKLAGKKSDPAKLQQLLALTGLTDKQQAYPCQLSGGQKQRVAIARALINEPDILLCDEATSALDPATTQSILRLLKDINETLGITIVLITHEMDVIKAICDRVAVLEKGKIVEQGEVLQVLTHPRAKATRRLLGLDYHGDRLCLFEGRLSQTEDAQHPTPALRLSFMGAKTHEPIVSELMTQFGVVPNILEAQIESVQQQMIGQMVLTLQGGNADILKHVVRFLERYAIRTEVLGYVARSH